MSFEKWTEGSLRSWEYEVHAKPCLAHIRECHAEIDRLKQHEEENERLLGDQRFMEAEIERLTAENAELRKKIPLYRDLVARHRHAMGYLDCNESHSLKELGEP